MNSYSTTFWKQDNIISKIRCFSKDQSFTCVSTYDKMGHSNVRPLYMFKSRFKLYTIIRLMVQAAPKLPNVVQIGKTYSERNTTFCLIYNEESEVKKSYWGLFGSYPLGSSLLALDTRLYRLVIAWHTLDCNTWFWIRPL